MVINKEIIGELKKKKSITTIYRLIEKIRKESGYKWTKEHAACILAGNLNIDIAKYLPEEKLGNLRNSPTEVRIIETKSAPSSQKIQLKICGVSSKIPYLKSKMINDCKEMSETYQLFYLLENTIRSFILSTFQSEYPSTDWWDKRVPVSIKITVENRKKKENKNRWHGKRGNHPIFYTNFGDLKDIIINGHNWTKFNFFFPDQHWVISRLNDLELSRNIIAHNNLLPKDEVKRIEMYFRDWIKQIGDKAI